MMLSSHRFAHTRFPLLLLGLLSFTSPTRAQNFARTLDAGAPAIDAAVVLVHEGDAAQLAPDAEAPPSGELAPTYVSEPDQPPIELEVRGQRSNRRRLTRSAEAVTVVNLEQARKRSADLGEVMSRVAGVNIRRFGGLGSEFRLSINGLYDSAVRVFVDEVPIDRVYAVGIANVPVNLVDDVEIYRGVVPLRFGADALGGAINLTRPKRYETSAQASYQIGSYGLHRATLTGRYRHDATGFVAGVETFVDRADNDYEIDVEIPDERGQPRPTRVRRFHDGYRAYGVSAEVGVVERSWARKLMLRGFTSEYTKELQHNIIMSVPYGEVEYGAQIAGSILRYENTFAERFDVDAVVSYTYRSTDFVDKADWVYDWRGERIRMRRIAGEIEDRARDQVTWQHGGFARFTFDARLAPGHVLSASISPTYASRTGDERIQLDPSARDPLTAERKLLKSVFGVAYTTGLGKLARAPAEPKKRRMEHHRFENVLFAKSYIYRADTEEPLPGNVFRRRNSDHDRFGGGDSLRVTLVDDWLLAKSSYEYAIRLPATDEVFGNGVLTLANLRLEPELSHNVNLGLQLDKRRTRFGDFWVDLNLFARRSENMIVLLGNDRFYTYQNVYEARSLGVENSVKWTSPKQYVVIEGQFTYTDQRNTSRQGTFADFEGDRIPNRPWLNASWGSYLHFEKVLTHFDTIEPFYQGRFVGDFFRGWESVGLRASKQVIPEQVSHDVGLTYALLRDAGGRLYATFEVQNLSDALLYDSIGVVRPGRAFSLKLTGDL